MNGHPLFMWLLLAAALVLLFFPRLTRRLVLALLGKPGREAVGRRALNRQPDAITLVPSTKPPSPQARSILDALGKAGFVPAGVFMVKEMGMLPVHFMVRSSDQVTGAVYEHAAAGVWYDLYTHYQDGTSITFSTARLGGGLDPRPGHPVERLPGLDPSALLVRFLATRPSGAMKPVLPAVAPEAFARAYAESAAWRKRRGLSAEEVERVGSGRQG
jgi:hypothetical protein